MKIIPYEVNGGGVPAYVKEHEPKPPKPERDDPPPGF